MAHRARALLGAFLTLSVLYVLGVLFFLGPIVAADSPAGPIVPRPLGFVVAIVLYVLFFDWVAEQVRSPLKAALIVAVSQLLLVDVDFVLSGDRGVVAGAASALLLVVSWTLTGIVYSKLAPPTADVS